MMNFLSLDNRERGRKIFELFIVIIEGKMKHDAFINTIFEGKEKDRRTENSLQSPNKGRSK